jgi:predicted ABC-type ATPase
VRMFAGPNGSGKSTLIKNLKEKIHFGVYLNADEIEEEINKKHYIDLDKFSLILTNDHWIQYLNNQPTILSKIPKTLVSKIRIDQNIILGFPDKDLSYIAASITDFLREMLFIAKKSFTFETVMSHPSKIDFLNRLKKHGYRTYLYYVATESSDINIGRITTRIQKGGHSVDPDKVKERFIKSLSILYQAIKVSDRAYIFDNSGQEIKFLAEITSGSDIKMKVDISPDWFDKFVLSKSF